MSDTTTTRSARLVLNDDTVISRDCFEPDVLELNPGRVPVGETDQLPCAICSADDNKDAEPASAQK
jgi:hypothetical protein